jgi:hypothetical protein
MKRTLKIILLTVATGLAVYACSPKMNLTKSAASMTEKLMNINSNWSSMTPTYDDLCPSYLPDLGVRVRYDRAKPELAKAIVEGIVGKKAFLKGPHANGVDCSSASFGYYDPAFLTQLQEVLKTTLGSKVFVDKFGATYDAELKGYLRTYYLSYEAGTSRPEVEKAYLQMLEDPEKAAEAGFYLQEAFRSHADGLEADGYDWYESVTCPAFWLRRSIDGTADEFYSLLTLMLNTFDYEFETK